MTDGEPEGGIYPPADIPTIFIDGVMNLANSRYVVKCYLARFDPSIDAKSPYEAHVIAQLIMPIPSFIDTYAFFESGVRRMIKDGVASSDDVERARASYREAE
jgi:hypothetical protein